MSEINLQTQIIKDIKKLGFKVIHIEKGRGTNKTHRKGIPDLMIPVYSKTIWVELKSKSGKISKKQNDWIHYLLRHNHSVYVIKSFQEWELIKYKEKLINLGNEL